MPMMYRVDVVGVYVRSDTFGLLFSRANEALACGQALREMLPGVVVTVSRVTADGGCPLILLTNFPGGATAVVEGAPPPFYDCEGAQLLPIERWEELRNRLLLDVAHHKGTLHRECQIHIP